MASKDISVKVVFYVDLFVHGTNFELSLKNNKINIKVS